MVSIGIRVTKKEIVYSIIEKDANEYKILALDKFIVPQALEMPDRLSYVRNSFESIIKEFNIIYAGIRIPEIDTRHPTKNGIIERTYIEGVLQELFSNSTINIYFAGRKNTIAKLMGIKPIEVSAIINGDKVLCDFQNWANNNLNQRESIVAAISSYNAGGNCE